MRKIVVATFISLDGVMQAPGGPEEDSANEFKYGGWMFSYSDEVVNNALGDTFSTPYDLLLGRRTYDIFANYWPRMEKDPPQNLDDGDADIARQFNSVTKYVATHSPHTLTWKNSQALGNDVVGALRELKETDGPRLLVQGSSELVHTLLENDLVDELRLLIFPILLGKGKRLFGEGSVPTAFKITSSFISPGGVISANYQRTGAVKIDLSLLPPGLQDPA